MSAFDKLVDDFNSNLPNLGSDKTQIRKGKRPLKMPKNYDFSVRNVNWNDYKKDFILRTDAVWERQKLLDIFYTIYKVAYLIYHIDPHSLQC